MAHTGAKIEIGRYSVTVSTWGRVVPSVPFREQLGLKKVALRVLTVQLDGALELVYFREEVQRALGEEP